MATGSITIVGSVLGGPGGPVLIAPPVIQSNAACGEVLTPVLASGNNTINIPTTARAVVITPPPGNTIALTYKGASGDIGLVADLVAPFEWPFTSTPPATFVIYAASAFTLPMDIRFL